MRQKRGMVAILLAALLSLACLGAYAGLSFEAGTGAVFSGHNDVRAPSISGTDISLSDELETDPKYFIRVKLAYSTGRHNMELSAAPLRLEASGRVNKLVKFEDEEFSANVPLYPPCPLSYRCSRATSPHFSRIRLAGSYAILISR